jgi:hypothetical protein
VSEQSLKEREKWEVKMKVKMTIFAKAKEGFDFSKMIIFQFIFEKWKKNETENEPKMATVNNPIVASADKCTMKLMW